MKPGQAKENHGALGGPWTGHIHAVDLALGQRDVDGARRAWESAHLAAIESLSWEGLLETGQACLRIGGATGARTAAEPAARRAYFAALYRACRENSFEGILRLAEAFEELGDHEVVEECLGLVELKVDGEQTRQRVTALAGHLGAGHRAAEAAAGAGAAGTAWTDAAAASARARA